MRLWYRSLISIRSIDSRDVPEAIPKDGLIGVAPKTGRRGPDGIQTQRTSP